MGHFPNLPHKYSPDAQAERNWKKAKDGREGENYNHAEYNRNKYRKNYDNIESKKSDKKK